VVQPWVRQAPTEAEEETDDDEDAGEDGTTEEALDSDTNDEREPPLWIAVLPWCASIVEVFKRCQPQISVGMGVLWQGVTAVEVRSACLMLGIPRREWARHIDGVQYMARVIAELRNKEAADKARRQ
jgi:hypothetical protein